MNYGTTLEFVYGTGGGLNHTDGAPSKTELLTFCMQIKLQLNVETPLPLLYFRRTCLLIAL